HEGKEDAAHGGLLRRVAGGSLPPTPWWATSTVRDFLAPCADSAHGERYPLMTRSDAVRLRGARASPHRRPPPWSRRARATTQPSRSSRMDLRSRNARPRRVSRLGRTAPLGRP